MKQKTKSWIWLWVWLWAIIAAFALPDIIYPSKQIQLVKKYPDIAIRFNFKQKHKFSMKDMTRVNRSLTPTPVVK